MTNPMMRQKSRPRLAGQAALLVGAALLTGCVSWETTYPTATPTLTGDTGPEAALDEAERLANDAGNRALLEEAISAYEAIVEKRPANFRALSQLGQLTILLGAAYTEDAAEKGRLYKLAGDYNAAALYTNPEFRRLVDGGATLADATRVLGEREMNPMGFWCQSVFYFFKERLGTLGRIRNFAWIQEAQRVLTRMEEIDPDWRSDARGLGQHRPAPFRRRRQGEGEGAHRLSRREQPQHDPQSLGAGEVLSQRPGDRRGVLGGPELGASTGPPPGRSLRLERLLPGGCPSAARGDRPRPLAAEAWVKPLLLLRPGDAPQSARNEHVSGSSPLVGSIFPH
jgi:hypothetical protein